MTGYIKIFRSIKEWGWYKHGPTKDVFIHLLLEANYKPGHYMGHQIPVGSLPTGYPSLADALGLTVNQVRTAIKNLKKSGEITVKVTNKFSIITVIKWREYQSENSQNPVRTQSEPSQSTTLKEGKKGRRKEYTACAEKPDDVSDAVWGDFLSTRKAKKAPVTDTALKAIRREAEKVDWSMERALSECCSRGWQGFKADWITKDQPQNTGGVHYL